MAVRFNLAGGDSNRIAQIISDRESFRHIPYGLMTHSISYEKEQNAPRFASNPDYGISLAINATNSGAVDGIHDGGDTTLWTASADAGTWDFASTDQAFTGTQSIDATATANDDVASITRSSAISGSSYNFVTGHIFIDSWATTGVKDVELEFLLAGVGIGLTLSLSQYITTSLQGTWQTFSIPIGDFSLGSSNIDELQIRTVSTGPGVAPDYYLDVLQFEAIGVSVGPQEFVIKPDFNQILRVYGFSWTLVDNFTAPTAAGNGYGISYNKFGGLNQLTNGIVTQRIQAGKVLFSNTVRNHADIVNGPDSEIQQYWDDGTNVRMKTYTKFAGPVDLYGQRGDKYVFTVRDNLSSLIQLDIRADATIVTKQNGEDL